MNFPFCVSVVIICVLLMHLPERTSQVGLLGKKNFILAKPRIIIKPHIYIGSGHSPKHKFLAKKKKLAVKTLAIGSAVGLLKKLKPKLPKIELPSLFPKIPISFSFSVEKPKLEVSKAGSWDDGSEHSEPIIDEHDEHTHHHIPAIAESPWFGEGFSFPEFPEEYHVQESKRHKGKVKSSKSSRSKSRRKSIKGSSSNDKPVTSKPSTKPPADEEEEDSDSES